MSSHTPSNTASAQSLLNLLNFGSNAQSSSTESAPQPTLQSSAGHEPSRSMSASDLVARLMSPGAASAHPQAANSTNLEDQGGGGPSRPQEAPISSQDALLKLLSKAQSSKSSRAASAEMQRSSSGPSKAIDPTNQNATSEAASGQAAKPLFTYQNPFEQLNASRQPTPLANEGAPAGSPIFKNLSEIPQPSIEIPAETQRASSPSEVPTRKILTPRSASARAGRLARESSVKSTGIPEQAIKEESPAINMEDLPIRTVNDISVHSAQAEQHDDSGVADTAPNESPQAGADEWEDAEESPVVEEESRTVPVYNFPIRPFVSITLQLDKPSNVEIREDGVMEISRLKKDFDQLDRSLAAATTKYIAYALVKNGGIRIIRQDDGVDRQVFKHSHDRVFNVAFCTTATATPASAHQAVLGTGVSGTVYYATISKDANDLFENNALETESLAFPPWPPADDNTAGGALKTRAKRSSRHPEYFAIGRGKSIHLVWPANSMCSRFGVTDTNRNVDMEKLYQVRNLQIATGKAGKDFAFSEDDTMIVSLDKTGRLRFWDIRELTDETNATASRVTPVKVEVPLLSLSTASPAEKSWPTSVLFVDKTRPYVKGGALRYVLVGLRQNHTLQLWDVALGKAVQELNFPHENETDGVCSVVYHPHSGIIVVGHPTRNSLFFIHLSAPRYTLSSSTTQAAYIQRVAARDPEIPRPDSTACMSGVREISFASKGQLRSVELLPIHKAPGTSKSADEKTGLFELYVVHSKGVTCLTINKQDLGWDANSKVLHGVDAAKEGVVNLKELKLGGIIEEVRSTSPPEDATPTPSASKASKKKSKKNQQITEGSEEITSDPMPVAAAVAAAQTSGLSNGFTAQLDVADSDAQVPKETKKSKKKAAQASEATASAKTLDRTSSPNKVDVPAPTSTSTDQPQTSQTTETAQFSQTADLPTSASEDMDVFKMEKDKVSVGISGSWLDKEIRKIVEAMSFELKRENDKMYTKLSNDRILQDATNASRQEAVLRLVSATLTNNVDKALAGIIGANIQNVVLPTLTNITSQAINAQLGEAIAKTLHHLTPTILATQLPSAISSALSNPQMTRSISENVTFKVSKSIEALVIDLIAKNVIPSVKQQIDIAVDDVALKTEARVLTEVKALQDDRKRDMARLEKFGQIIQGFSETIQTMSENQVAFQKQIMQERQHLVVTAPSSAGMSPLPAPIARPAAVKAKTQEELDREEIAKLMGEGRYESASVKWLHTTGDQQVHIFDTLFVKFTPEYLATDVSSLVAFSVAVAIGNFLQTNTRTRLEWVLAALTAVDPYVSFTSPLM